MNIPLVFGLGFWEIVLLFGAKKIPELMKGLGKGVNSFKEGMKEGEEVAKSSEKEDGK